jgi:hypothetical protein
MPAITPADYLKFKADPVANAGEFFKFTGIELNKYFVALRSDDERAAFLDEVITYLPPSQVIEFEKETQQTQLGASITLARFSQLSADERAVNVNVSIVTALAELRVLADPGTRTSHTKEIYSHQVFAALLANKNDYASKNTGFNDYFVALRSDDERASFLDDVLTLPPSRINTFDNRTQLGAAITLARFSQLSADERAANVDESIVTALANLRVLADPGKRKSHNNERYRSQVFAALLEGKNDYALHMGQYVKNHLHDPNPDKKNNAQLLLKVRQVQITSQQKNKNKAERYQQKNANKALTLEAKEILASDASIMDFKTNLLNAAPIDPNKPEARTDMQFEINTLRAASRYDKTVMTDAIDKLIGHSCDENSLKNTAATHLKQYSADKEGKVLTTMMGDFFKKNATPLTNEQKIELYLMMKPYMERHGETYFGKEKSLCKDLREEYNKLAKDVSIVKSVYAAGEPNMFTVMLWAFENMLQTGKAAASNQPLPPSHRM